MPELFRKERSKDNIHWLNALPLHRQLDSVRWYEETDPVSGVTLCHVYAVILRPFAVDDRTPITDEVMADIRFRVQRIVEGLRTEGYPPENMRLEYDCVPLVLGVGNPVQNARLDKVILRLLKKEWGLARKNRLRQVFTGWRRRVQARKAANHWMDRCMRPEHGRWYKMCQRRFLALSR